MGSDNEPYPLPEDPALAQVSAALNEAGYWGTVFDDRWRVVYATDELRLSFGGHEQLARFAIGEHIYSAADVAVREEWRFGPRTLEHQRLGLESLGSMILADTPGGRDELRGLVAPELRDVVDRLDPADDSTVALLGASGGTVARDRAVHVPSVAIRVRDHDGRLRGTVTLSKPPAGMATMAAMTAAGDLGHLRQMQQVARADRRPAALLFADVASSTPLARRLSTANYFTFVRRFVRAVDRCVVEAGGLVGRHAGDGVVALFLAESLGSESSAAQACIRSARAIVAASEQVAQRCELRPGDLALRFGLHWGSALYVGNVASVGRSEVTALGDAMNEAARIEECARGGRMLASKDLLERLTGDDAAALGVDPGALVYTAIGELPTASAKARRDAATIAVCDVTPR